MALDDVRGEEVVAQLRDNLKVNLQDFTTCSKHVVSVSGNLWVFIYQLKHFHAPASLTERSQATTLGIELASPHFNSVVRDHKDEKNEK
ncbi:hypothetical protein LMG26857_03594 [Achromobacter anxifer]|nr:hypothetical protein LMG26857_03594 [Achromobacter anxifer]